MMKTTLSTRGCGQRPKRPGLEMYLSNSKELTRLSQESAAFVLPKGALESSGSYLKSPLNLLGPCRAKLRSPYPMTACV